MRTVFVGAGKVSIGTAKAPGDRQRVEFGVRLVAGHERFVSPGIYSQVKELVSGEELQQRGLGDISTLAVTEIISVHPPEEQD